MPTTRVVLYREDDGTVPIRDWLRRLDEKVRNKCIVKLHRLGALGHELRRPEADLLRSGIYELRVGYQGQNFRILYFFHGNAAAVVSHGIVKERVVPDAEIDRALRRKWAYLSNPEQHTGEVFDV
jgi:phage-related protein